MESLLAPLKDLFTKSKLLILNFDELTPSVPPEENIALYFQACETQGVNPRLPENRQKFNNSMLRKTGVHYLVSRYGEDRHSMLTGSEIAREGRVLHLGVDIFCEDLEQVYAPCDGRIVRSEQEHGSHSFGHYLILKPDQAHLPYLFLGHLSAELPSEGDECKAGQPIARLGDFVDNENGGWSRHLHLQMLTELPPVGEAPIGYSTKADFAANAEKFPDPMPYFPDWVIRQ